MTATTQPTLDLPGVRPAATTRPPRPADLAACLSDREREVLRSLVYDGPQSVDDFVARIKAPRLSYAPVFTWLRKAGYVRRTGSQSVSPRGGMSHVLAATDTGRQALIPPHARRTTGPTDLADFQTRLRTILTDHTHIATFTDFDYGLRHPLTCRPNLIDCPVDAALRSTPYNPAPAPGTYLVAVGPSGALLIGERVADDHDPILDALTALLDAP